MKSVNLNWQDINELKDCKFTGEILTIDELGYYNIAYKSVTGWRFREQHCNDCDNLLLDPPSFGGWRLTHFCILNKVNKFENK